MEKVKKRAKIWLSISLILMLVCSIAVSGIQTNGWSVSMKEMCFETDAGYSMSAYLFKPDGVSAENPAPAIVTSHGYLNNKEMQDANYVELARRGFVVLAIDQPCHGDSEIIPNTVPDGTYQAALALSSMPFVDKSRIGITGHSMGGMSCNLALMSDNMSEEPIISAILLNCADAIYTDNDNNYVNIYGNRDVAIVSAVYDEFFHMFPDKDGVLRESPFFMEHETAQSFLNFGVNPEGLEKRDANVQYHQDIDGKDAIRVIYRPAIIHPWSHFSAKSTSAVIDFFDAAFGSPNPIPADNQIWQWKEAFNCLGLIGLVIFICSFGILMVFTKPFASLRAEEVVQPRKVTDGKGKLWFWLSLLAGTVFSTLIYLPVLAVGVGLPVSQGESMGLGLWSTLCGVFTILSMLLFYFCYGKKNGVDLEAVGVKMPIKKLGLSLLLGLIIAVMAYLCVFVADYFFYADFRIWTLALKAFELPMLRYLPYVALFFTFYIASSVANNCFNYNNIGGKSWVNTIIIGVFTALPAVILPAIQYIHYVTVKSMMWPEANMAVLWLFPIILILFVSTVITRILYKVTKNPYIAGVTNAIIIGILTITNTCTMAF